ncbi:RmlC-like cupin domain-containing protein, partial [Syncephalis pseudoplumigaleata]
LDDLVRLLRLEMGEHGLDSKEVDVKRIQQLMANYTSCDDDWKRYALFDPYRYTRNLVDDGNGKFNLLVLAWGAQHQSAIHDHSNSHCVMKILDGELQEEQFEWPDTGCDGADCPAMMTPDAEDEQGAMTLIKSSKYHRDDVTYIHDRIGLHRVGNLSTKKGAVSLHLYTPPITMCRTFCEGTGKARASGCTTFYSVHGERV